MLQSFATIYIINNIVLLTFWLVGLQKIIALKNLEFNWDTQHVNQLRKAAFGCLGIMGFAQSKVESKSKEAMHEGAKSSPNEVAYKPESAQTKNKIEGHIMLSYNWSTKEIIKKLKVELQKNGLKTWIDDEDIQPGSLNDSLSAAVEQSAAVLVCYSDGYKRSPNCRSEAEYAQVTKKPMLFIRTEKKYKPDGWLGLLLGNTLYYDITDEATFDTVAGKIIAAIKSMISKGPDRSADYGKQGAVGGTTKREERATKVEGNPKKLAATSGAVEKKAESEWQKWTVEQVQRWITQKDLTFLKESYELNLSRLFFIFTFKF